MPAYKKALPVIAGIVCLAYVLFPFDALPDPYPLIGQIDDAVVTLLIMAPSIWLFIRICPKELVKEHSSDISSGASWK